MSGFLQEVGYSQSFLGDNNVFKGDSQLWQQLTRGMINNMSLENKIFRDNLAFKQFETKQYQEQKERRVRLLKQKLQKQQMLEEGKLMKSPLLGKLSKMLEQENNEIGEDDGDSCPSKNSPLKLSIDSKKELGLLNPQRIKCDKGSAKREKLSLQEKKDQLNMLVNKLEKTGHMDNKYKHVISLKEADIQLEEYMV